MEEIPVVLHWSISEKKKYVFLNTERYKSRKKIDLFSNWYLQIEKGMH